MTMAYESVSNIIMEGLQASYQNEHGSEPMPAKMEAAVHAGINLLIDIACSLDTIARSAQMVADKLESESVAQD